MARPIESPPSTSRGQPSPTPDRNEKAAGDRARHSYAPASACWVDNTGALPNETRTCTFTATRAGGWNFDFFWTPGWNTPIGSVTVTRDERETTYEPGPFTGEDKGSAGTHTWACAADIIAVGDLVEVSLTQGPEEGAAVAKVGAGYRWDCDHQGS